MPVDLYVWEAGGGLVHHCPKCFKPLTTPQARSRCLGEHVEWCHRYHTQLFKKGSSSQCAPCRNGDEEHHKRHREIAELVHKLSLLNSTPTTPASKYTPAADEVSADDATPKTKKERKDAKKAKKISELPKSMNAALVTHVGNVLHPNIGEAQDSELEHQLLNDPEINDNRFFHRGTSNKREIRNVLVKKDRKGDKVVISVGAEEMQGLLQLLDVSPVTASTSSEEKKIIELLKQKIEADFVQVQEEMDGTMMRKAGFWRWASKKAYNRLVANGNIWEKKGEDFHGGKSDESGGSTEDDAIFSAGSADASDDTNVTEPDTDGTTIAEDSVADGMSALSLKPKEATNTPKTPKTVVLAGDGDGWTSVGSQKGAKGKGKNKQSTPKMTIKLTPNNGLAKMVQSSTPRTPSFLRYHGQEE